MTFQLSSPPSAATSTRRQARAPAPVLAPRSCDFVIIGEPEPQGSAKAYVRGNRAIVTSDNPKLKPWRASIAWHAAEARLRVGAFDCAVRVRLVFAFNRPKTAPKRVTMKTTRPDVDKLARAMLDGLTEGGLIRDDAQVVELMASKCFSGQHHALPTPGCYVEVGSL